MPDFRRALFNFLMFAFSATLRIDIGPARECIPIHPSHSVPAYPMTCPDFRLIFCFRLDQLRVFQGANDECAPSASRTIYKSVWVSINPRVRRCFFFGDVVTYSTDFNFSLCSSRGVGSRLVQEQVNPKY